MGSFDNHKWSLNVFLKNSKIFGNKKKQTFIKNKCLFTEVETLLEKGAIEIVPKNQIQEGFYSTFFLVRKKNGEMTIQNKIFLKAAYLAGRLNTLADHLSRVKIRPSEWSLNSLIVQKFVSPLGKSCIRPVCLDRQSQDSNFLFMGPPPSSISNGCSVNILGQDDSIFVSANMPDSQSPSTHVTIPLSSSVNITTMAKTTLVHNTASNARSSSNKVTSNKRNAKSNQNKHISPKPRNIQSDGMVALNRGFKTKCFSRRVRELLSASWQLGTQKDYTSKFKSSIVGVVNSKKIPIQSLW